MIAKATLHTIHHRFRKTSAMIADIFFPTPSAATPNVADRRVTRQRTLARIAVPFNLCVSLRRNNHLDSPLLQRFVNLPYIAYAVAVKSIDLAVYLIPKGVRLAGVVATVFRQCFRLNLVRGRIHRQVQCLPCATLRFAMFSHFPFAFAENFQSGAVLSTTTSIGPACFLTSSETPNFCGPLGQRCEIGNGDGDLHQLSERFSESFGLAIGQSKCLTQDEQAFDGGVAVDKRMSDLRFRVGVMSFFNGFFAKQEGNRASLHKRLVIFSPICDFVRTFPCTGHVKTPSRRVLFFASSLFYVLKA